MPFLSNTKFIYYKLLCWTGFLTLTNFLKFTKDLKSQRLYRHLSNGYKVTIEKIHLHKCTLFCCIYSVIWGFSIQDGQHFYVKTYEIGMRQYSCEWIELMIKRIEGRTYTTKKNAIYLICYVLFKCFFFKKKEKRKIVIIQNKTSYEIEQSE